MGWCILFGGVLAGIGAWYWRASVRKRSAWHSLSPSVRMDPRDTQRTFRNIFGLKK